MVTGTRHDLMLVWKQPETRERYLIGHLWFDGTYFRFRYENDLPRSLEEARAVGFRVLEPFPSIGQEYQDERLFPVFWRRVPRHLEDLAAFQEIISAPDLSPDFRALELLRLTGGRMPTDTLEFLEPALQSDDVEGYEFRFPVAGWRYYSGESVMFELCEGVLLPLGFEPENDWDRFAIKVLSPSGVHIGYVPSIFSWYLAEFVDQGLVRAEVERIGEPSDPQRRVGLQVRVTLSSLTEPPTYRLVPSRIQDYAEMLLV